MSQERYALNKQLAQMLKGGVIMDVTTPEQAKIAEEAGACAVMALERRCFQDERPQNDQRNPGGSLHSGYGEMSYRTFCRSADSGSN